MIEIVLIIIGTVAAMYLIRSFNIYLARRDIEKEHMARHSYDCEKCVRTAAIRHVRNLPKNVHKNHRRWAGMQKLVTG